MRIVAFNGSPRPEGNTARLLQLVEEVVRREGIEVDFVQLGGQLIRGCTACQACGREGSNHRCAIANDPLNGYLDLIERADGLLIGSPTYFGTVTTEVKAFIDRVGYVSRGKPELLRRKAGAAVVATRRSGSLTTFNTINQFFLIAEMVVPGSSYWNMSQALAPGDWQKDQEGIDTMLELGKNLAWLLKKLNA